MKAESARGVKKEKLWLPVCLVCSRVQYPPREVCVDCLSDALEWQSVDNHGEVLATTVQHYSLDEKFKPQLPLHVASVKLDSGPVVIGFSPPDLRPGQKVSVFSRSKQVDKLSLHIVAAINDGC